MLREILTPTSTTLTLELPDELVGKEIEVLAFELNVASFVAADEAAASVFEQRLAALTQLAARYPIDLSNFKFDRDEANDYAE